MRAIHATVSVVVLATAAAHAQLYGITAAGDLYTIDRVTGGATFVGSSGHGSNAAAADAAGHIISMTSPFEAYVIDPATGATLQTVPLSNAGVVGYGPRGLAIDSTGAIWVALSKADTGEIDLLATLSLVTGSYTAVGPMVRTDIQGLACDAADNLYAIGVIAGGAFCSVNKTTGACSVIGAGSFGGDTQALEFDDAGVCYALRTSLLRVDVGTGAATLIGATGQADFRGMAFIGSVAPCYPDCNADGVLNLSDFGCFATRFALGDSYADCNGDTVLNLSDFGCFQTKVALGCP
ncbi:MAG: hypothetical protein IT437_02485 [Phycisphaerales bacterium]|nr:hypothetical protein [Phycisphaerales bacterium]